jgi:hypothetical protein
VYTWLLLGLAFTTAVVVLFNPFGGAQENTFELPVTLNEEAVPKQIVEVNGLIDTFGNGTTVNVLFCVMLLQP